MAENSNDEEKGGDGLHASDVPPPPVSRPPKPEPAYPEREKTETPPPPPVSEEEDDDLEEEDEVKAGSDEKILGLLCHMLALVGCLVPLIGNVLGPLVLWMLKRGDSALVETEGRKSVNFQILFSAAVVILWLPMLVVGLVPVLGALVVALCAFVIVAGAIANVVYVILATMAVNSGQKSKYPMSIDVLEIIESKMAKSKPGD